MKFKCSQCGKKFKAEISAPGIRQLPKCPGKLFRKCGATVDEDDEYVGPLKSLWRWLGRPARKALPKPTTETDAEEHALEHEQHRAGMKRLLTTPAWEVAIVEAGRKAGETAARRREEKILAAITDQPTLLQPQQCDRQWISGTGYIPFAEDGSHGCKAQQPELEAEVMENWERDEIGLKLVRRKNGKKYGAIFTMRQDTKLEEIPPGMLYPRVDIGSAIRAAVPGGDPREHQDIYGCVRSLINVARTQNNYAQEVRKVYALVPWLNEFRTIRVKTARQTGHTTAANNLAVDMAPSLVVVHDHVMKDAYKSLGWQANSMCLTYREVMGGHSRGHTFETIVIDLAQWCSQNPRDIMGKLRPALMNAKDPWIIMLG